MRYRSNMAWHTARSEELYIDKEEMPVVWSSGHLFLHNFAYENLLLAQHGGRAARREKPALPDCSVRLSITVFSTCPMAFSFVKLKYIGIYRRKLV